MFIYNERCKYNEQNPDGKEICSYFNDVHYKWTKGECERKMLHFFNGHTKVAIFWLLVHTHRNVSHTRRICFPILLWNGIISPASLDKSPGEDNSEGEYLHVRASGFRDRKFPMVIFSPKKRSGIAVRVGERSGTWQAKRPTTHKYRVKEKQSGGAVFCNIGNPNGLPPSHHIPTEYPPPVSRNTSGRDKGFARSQLCILQFPFCRCCPVRRWRCPVLFPCRPFPCRTLRCGAVSPRVTTIFPFPYPSLRWNMLTYGVIYILTHCKSIIYQN